MQQGNQPFWLSRDRGIPWDSGLACQGQGSLRRTGMKWSLTALVLPLGSGSSPPQTQVTRQHRAASEPFGPTADPRDPIYAGGRQRRNKTSKLPPSGFHRLASVHCLRREGGVDSLRDSTHGQSSLARWPQPWQQGRLVHVALQSLGEMGFMTTPVGTEPSTPPHKSLLGSSTWCWQEAAGWSQLGPHPTTPGAPREPPGPLLRPAQAALPWRSPQAPCHPIGETCCVFNYSSRFFPGSGLNARLY